MLDLHRWPHADTILDEALDRPAAERAAYIRATAAGDDALVAALELVLAEADRGDDFLNPGGALTGPLAHDWADGDTAAAAASLEPGMRFGAYEITERIGAGGMGEVYRAHDLRLRRDVALKVLPRRTTADPRARERLAREARLLASLNHPRIAAIYDLAEQDGALALVLELVEGSTLAERLERGPLRIEDAIDVAGQIAEALDAAHARGIVHSDLKPANVKLTDRAQVKVLDFGIARALDDDPAEPGQNLGPSETTNVHAHGVFGTAPYIAPERIRGLPVDHRVDIWAFGCVLYEMLAGVRAFGSGPAPDILTRILDREPELSRLPVRTPASIVRLLERTFRKDPARRLGYIGDARLELDDAREELAGRSDATPVPRTVKRRWRIATAAALVIGIAAGGTAVWRATRVTPAPPAHLALPISDDDDLVAGEVPGLAISPDGRTVVYRTRRGGIIQLIERSLDRPGAAVLPDSTNAASPFFSPDNHWIGFAGESALMKVPSAGGPAAKIVDTPGGARASWADDQTIVFSMGTARVLHRVSAAGGAATPVTHLGAGQLSHEAPQVLPGSRAAVLTVARKEGHRVGIARLDTGDVTELAPGRDPQIVGRRWLVFARDDGLWAAPFDETRLALAGDPFLVAEGIELGTVSGVPHYAVSEAGTLLYLPRRPALDLRALVWVTREGATTPVPIERRSYSRASLSPDGARIALAVSTPAESDVWIFEMSRGTFMRLTVDPGVDTAPVWTPDGRRVAFRSERDGGGIFLADADGAGRVDRLTSSAGPLRPAHTPHAFTPDGHTLLFTELRSYADQDIGAVTLDAPPRVSMILRAPFAESRPALSPDGKWLAYQSDESGHFEIYVRPYPDVEASRVQVSTRGGTSARWGSGGHELFFFDGAAMVAVPMTASAKDARLTPGAPRRLFDATRFSDRLGPVYNVGRDGRFLFLDKATPEGTPPRRAELRIVERWSTALERGR